MKIRLAFIRVLATLPIVALALAGAAASARNAPDFTLPTPEGKHIVLSSLRGKLVVIEFLQTTCTHCQRAGQILQKLYLENADRMEIVGISHDAMGMAAIRKYKEEHNLSYPVVLGDLSVAVNYLGISPQRPNFHVPVFFFIGPDGQIVEERNPDRYQDKDWFLNAEVNLEATVLRLLPPRPKPAGKSAKRGGARKPAAAKKKS